MLKVGGCFSFSCWLIFILMEHTIPTDIHCIQELVEGGGAGSSFINCLFVFALLDFPILPYPYGYGRMGKSKSAKTNKQLMKEEPAPPPSTNSWIQCMSVGIVCSIKMNINQQENEKQPPTFSIACLQSGFESPL